MRRTQKTSDDKNPAHKKGGLSWSLAQPMLVVSRNSAHTQLLALLLRKPTFTAIAHHVLAPGLANVLSSGLHRTPSSPAHLLVGHWGMITCPQYKCSGMGQTGGLPNLTTSWSLSPITPLAKNQGQSGQPRPHVCDIWKTFSPSGKFVSEKNGFF